MGFGIKLISLSFFQFLLLGNFDKRYNLRLCDGDGDSCAMWEFIFSFMLLVAKLNSVYSFRGLKDRGVYLGIEYS